MLRSSRGGNGGTAAVGSPNVLFLLFIVVCVTLAQAGHAGETAATNTSPTWAFEALTSAAQPLVGALSSTPLPGQLLSLKLAPATQGHASRPLLADAKSPSTAHLLAMSLDGKAQCAVSAALSVDTPDSRGQTVTLVPRIWTLLPIAIPTTVEAGKVPALHVFATTDANTTLLLAVPDSPSPQVVNDQLLYLGTLLAGAGKYDEALATWQQYATVTKGTPAEARARLYEGDALKGLGDRAKAVEAYRAALAAVDPANAKPGVGDVGNYTYNRLASDLGSMIRGRLAAMVPQDKLTDKDVTTLEELAAVWPPTPEAKQAALQLAQYQIANKQVTPQTVSYLVGIFDASGDRTSPHTTKLADNQALIDRISKPTDKALVLQTLELLNQLAPQYGLGEPLKADALKPAAEDWGEAERAALQRGLAGAADYFDILTRKYKGTVLARLATLATAQWAEKAGAYRQVRQQYGLGVEFGGPVGLCCRVGLAELNLACGSRDLAARDLQRVLKEGADTRLNDWASFRLAQGAEFSGQWQQASDLYARVRKSRHAELAEEAQMAAVRLAALSQSPAARQPAVRYLGEDRSTQGDWYTYYGSEAFILCAQQAPQDVAGGKLDDWVVKPTCGNPAEKVRYWISGPSDDHPSMLYNPLSRVRRAANWDDRGEAYPRGTGPDLWLEVPVPAGDHRLTLYFVNDHNYYEPRRSYTLSVFDENGVYQTGADVRDFVNGVYEQFSATGPGKLKILISRNLSMNVLLAGVFCDTLHAPEFDSAGLKVLPQMDAWHYWQEQRESHLSSHDEEMAFSAAISGAIGREDRQILETFLDILADDELACVRYGPALWACQARYNLPNAEYQYRLGRMRLTIDRFSTPAAISQPHASTTLLAWPSVIRVFESYIATATQDLDSDDIQQLYRSISQEWRAKHPLLAALALDKLVSLVGIDKLTREEKLCLATDNPDYAKTVASLEQALKTQPPPPNYNDLELQLLGCYLTASELENAAKLVEQMRERDPQRPGLANAIYSLGNGYLRCKQPERAVACFRQVMERFPDSPWSKLAQERLKRAQAPTPVH